MSTLSQQAVTYCPGSFTKVTRRGSKYIRGRLKYLCPECKGHYARDSSGHLYKHGYKLGDISSGSYTSVCGSCYKEFVGQLDYICPKCRARQE